MERTTLLLPPALRERAALLARERGQSLAELIRGLLLRELEQNQPGAALDPLYTDDALWTGPSSS